VGATQEALAIAAERWPRDGVPANPGAWPVTTARHRAINRIRRDRTLAAKTRLLVGAKGKIRAAQIPFPVPPEPLLAERLAAVLVVVSLVFHQGDGGRGEPAAEALRLGWALAGRPGAGTRRGPGDRRPPLSLEGYHYLPRHPRRAAGAHPPGPPGLPPSLAAGPPRRRAAPAGAAAGRARQRCRPRSPPSMINPNLRRRCPDVTRETRVSRIGVANPTSTSNKAPCTPTLAPS
jgi:hypothetical protein